MLGPRTLSQPTTKEFQQLFRFLISELLDPGMQWSKKFEEDAISVLKDLRYPAMDMIGKTALGAPGTGMNWPALLAMLHWLVELCKVSCSAMIASGTDFRIGARQLGRPGYRL